MFAETLRLAQTDSLTNEREVVSRATVGRSFTVFDQEKRARPAPRILVAFRPIGPEPHSCTAR